MWMNVGEKRATSAVQEAWLRLSRADTTGIEVIGDRARLGALEIDAHERSASINAESAGGWCAMSGDVPDSYEERSDEVAQLSLRLPFAFCPLPFNCPVHVAADGRLPRNSPS
jgi:hypothetical protein